MLATGCRMGEALAVRYGLNGDRRPLLDLAAGTWEVNATVVRVRGQGLIIQPRPKSAAGWRVVALPDFAARMLERRRAAADGRAGEIVFVTLLAVPARRPATVAAVNDPWSLVQPALVGVAAALADEIGTRYLVRFPCRRASGQV